MKYKYFLFEIETKDYPLFIFSSRGDNRISNYYPYQRFDGEGIDKSINIFIVFQELCAYNLQYALPLTVFILELISYTKTHSFTSGYKVSFCLET